MCHLLCLSCAKSGKIVLKEGTKTQDRECGLAMTTRTILPTPSKIIMAISRTTATTPSPSNTEFTTIDAITVPFIQTSKQDRECDHAMTTPTTMTTTTISETPSKIIIALSLTTATTPSPRNTDFTTIDAMEVPFIQTSNSLPLSHPSQEASPTHRMRSQSATVTTSVTRGRNTYNVEFVAFLMWNTHSRCAHGRSRIMKGFFRFIPGEVKLNLKHYRKSSECSFTWLSFVLKYIIEQWIKTENREFCFKHIVLPFFNTRGQTAIRGSRHNVKRRSDTIDVNDDTDSAGGCILHTEKKHWSQILLQMDRYDIKSERLCKELSTSWNVKDER